MAEITNLPWEKLSGCNILVTGATGLIGSCLVDMLMDNPHRDYHVYALGRNATRAAERFHKYQDSTAFHFMQGDVTRPLESDISFHYIIHAASNGSPNFFVNNPVEVMKSNLFGVANQMEYGLNHGMRRFLYVSTGEVYGQNEAELLDESSYGYVDILNTRSCYPSSKRAAETLAMCYAGEYGADVVVARPCHTYGPHFTESDNRVYAQFIRNVLNGEDIVLKSAGTQYRSWCYVEDCVSALLYILLKGESGQAYNIADKNSVVTIRELAEMIARIAGRKVVMQVASENEKKEFTPIKHAVFDTSKLESLGWQVTGTMEEKLRRTIEVAECMYL
ncbi:MAG: NAD-dependent epimerase/dehydratase family protein [Bacteroidales bacterium]|nr:NAD-dependent epimerase/dehydratase family protein [Bacteroidales bacterium]